MTQQCRPLLTLPAVSRQAVAYARAMAFDATVQYPGEMNLIQASAAGQRVLGIAARGAAIGERFEVIAQGSAVCEAGAALSAGARVMSDASGRVIAATAIAVKAGATGVTSTAANGSALLDGAEPPLYAFGIALQDAAAAGDLIEVLITG